MGGLGNRAYENTTLRIRFAFLKVRLVSLKALLFLSLCRALLT